MPWNRKLPLNEAELSAFEATRDIGAEIIQSIREMKAGVGHVICSPYLEARQQTGLSRAEFAALIGVSVRTVRGWEQGRQQPSGPARALLTIARTNPQAVLALSTK